MITKIVLDNGEIYFVGELSEDGKIVLISEDFAGVPNNRVFNVEFDNGNWIEIQGHAVKSVYYTRSMK